MRTPGHNSSAVQYRSRSLVDSLYNELDFASVDVAGIIASGTYLFFLHSREWHERAIDKPGDGSYRYSIRRNQQQISATCTTSTFEHACVPEFQENRFKKRN
jgi:hypothetical protein